MNIKPYSKYKPSGIEWFGALPSHWVVKRLRFATERIEQGWSPQCDNQAADDDAWGVMKVGCVNGDQFDASENKALPPELDPKTEYELRPGDVLISRANTRELVGSAAIVPSDVRSKLLLCDKLFRIALSPEVDAAYLTFCLRTRAARFQYEQDATGASGSMQNIGQDAIKNLVFPFPSYAEQQQIAAFLDWKTDQIDALIAKKQALLQKLKEKRLAVITQAVTKGLNPDAPMRDSGIAWLGEVPEHWQTKRLRHCAGLVTSGSRGWAQHFADTGSLFLRITNLTRDSIQLLLDDLQRVEPPEGAEGDRTFTKPGDLLISITADLGSVAVIPEGLEGAYVSQHLSLVRLDSDDIESRWIAYSILSHIGKHQLVGAGYGGTKVQLSLADIKEIVFCHPPTRDEQKRVLEFIQAETAKSDELISLAESAITRLTEYRSALITAATTGKIDVRGWQAPQETV